VSARFEVMENIPAIDYLNRKARLDELAQGIASRIADVDVIVGPTLPITPPTLQSVTDDAEYRAKNMAILNNTMIANLLQLCAVSLPVALDAENMPVGLMIMAPLDADERVLAVALAIESKLGTATDRIGMPPILGY